MGINFLMKNNICPSCNEVAAKQISRLFSVSGLHCHQCHAKLRPAIASMIAIFLVGVFTLGFSFIVIQFSSENLLRIIVFLAIVPGWGLLKLEVVRE